MQRVVECGEVKECGMRVVAAAGRAVRRRGGGRRARAASNESFVERDGLLQCCLTRSDTPNEKKQPKLALAEDVGGEHGHTATPKEPRPAVRAHCEPLLRVWASSRLLVVVQDGARQARDDVGLVHCVEQRLVDVRLAQHEAHQDVHRQ